MTKVLLVEDDKSLREIYGVRLLAEGYDIVSAGDGEEALAMAIKEKPQLIISDVMMPKISGFDMLDILRSTTETRDIKVIMMTALSSDDQRARGEQLGADRYLVKSQVGIEDVVRTVHEVLDGKSPESSEPTKSDDSSDTSDNESSSASAENHDDNTNSDADTSNDETNSAEDTDNTKEESNIPPTGEDAAPTATDDSSDSATLTPGNEDAGPLPPQPTEMESTLPEPTAPFSSQRPTNLGENAMNPTDPTTPVTDNGGAVVPPEVPAMPPVEPPVMPPAPEVPEVPAAPEAPVVPPAPGVPGEEQQPPAVPPVPPAPVV